MPSVTQRIKDVRQPRGGYLSPKNFHCTDYDDGIILNEENISPITMGLAIDYMTRVELSKEKVKDIFIVSIHGASVLGEEELRDVFSLMKKVKKGMSEETIKAVIQLSHYDTAYRAGKHTYKKDRIIEPDDKTIENIITMTKRSIKFFEEYGPITSTGFTFGKAYTYLIDAGDGDFLTDSTLWDFKVSVKEPTSRQTLQLLIYYLMGKESKKKEFKNISKIGIFNPRLNKVHEIDISKVDTKTINEVRRKVIGYR